MVELVRLHPEQPTVRRRTAITVELVTVAPDEIHAALAVVDVASAVCVETIVRRIAAPATIVAVVEAALARGPIVRAIETARAEVNITEIVVSVALGAAAAAVLPVDVRVEIMCS